MLPLNPSEFLEDEPVIPLCEKPNDRINRMYQRYYLAAAKKTECELLSSIYKLDTALEFFARSHATSVTIPMLILSMTTIGVSILMGYATVADLIELASVEFAISLVKMFAVVGCVGILGVLYLLFFGGKRVQKQIPQYLLYKHACEQCLKTKMYIGGENASNAAATTIQPAAQMGCAGSGTPAAAPLIDQEVPVALSGQGQI